MAGDTGVQNRVREFFGLSTTRDIIPVVVNFIGTAVGFVAVGLCILMIRTELSYDTWVRNSERAYRLHMVISPPGAQTIPLPSVSPHLAGSIGQLSGVEDVTRLSREKMIIARHGTRYSETVQIVDPNFLDAFGLSLSEGTGPSVLDVPGSVVLTREAAQKYFGNTNPTGQVLELDTGDSLLVTGVLDPVPRNTHLDLNILVSSRTPFTVLNQQSRLADPGEIIAYTYFWLRDGIGAKDIASRLSGLLAITPVMPPEAAAVVKPVLGMMPVSEIHLNSFPAGELKPGGSRTMLGILAAIAVTITVIICINFSVLMMSRTEARTLEYGVRRTFGATRFQVVLGSLREGTVVTIAAMALAAAMIMAGHPVIAGLLGTTVLVGLSDCLVLLVPPLVVALVAGMAAILPANAAARMSPVEALKQDMPQRKVTWEMIPVVVQFSLTTIIAVLSLVVAEQTSFAVRSSVQAAGTGVFIIDAGAAGLPPSTLATFRDEARRIPGVRSVSLSEIVPTNFSTSMLSLMNQGQAAPSSFSSNSVDSSFFETFGLKARAGRLFSEHTSGQAGTRVIVLSEAALPALGFRDAQSAIGATVVTTWSEEPISFEVLGVVPDMTMKSVDAPLERMVYFPIGEKGRFIAIALDNPQDASVMEQIPDRWREVCNDAVFNGRFLDDRLSDLYRPLEQAKQALFALSLVAMATSCLGIYALTSLLSIRQRREVGIRRALGATRSNVTAYLSMRFLMPVIAGIVLGIPASVGIALSWLSGYTHRIALGPSPFLLSATGVVMIGMLAMVHHTIRLSGTEPASALRQ